MALGLYKNNLANADAVHAIYAGQGNKGTIHHFFYRTIHGHIKFCL